MRRITPALLVPLACLASPERAAARPYRTVLVPVVRESRTYSPLPRDPATTQAVDVGRVLVGYEAPADVDVYALTEDVVSDIPVVSIARRVSWRAAPTWRRNGPFPVRKG